MRAARLLSILLLLQAEGRLPARQLAERLEVTERTIYRDVDALSAAGVPVYAERGRHGGIRLLPGYQADVSALTSRELQALLAVDVDQAVAELGLGPSSIQARRKLVAALPDGRRAAAQKAVGRIHIDPAGWFSIPPTSTAAALARAIFDEHRARIRYVRRDERVVNRELAPLGLVLKAGEWYLVAASGPGDRARVYRVSRIQHIDLLDEGFSRPRDFDLARFWRAATRRFERSFSTFPVRLKVQAGGAVALRQILGEIAVQALRNARPIEDGTTEIVVPFESANQARLYLLGLADTVEVVGPAIVREALAAAAAAALQVYREPTPGRVRPAAVPRRRHLARVQAMWNEERPKK